MGGTIGVDSEEGSGSTFWFTARLARGSEGVNQLPRPRTDLAGLRVLVVDDNGTNREVLEQMLAAWGIRVVSATGGRAALRLLREAADQQDPISLAVLDFNMPEMDGVAVARAMAEDPMISNVRTVLLTSSAQLGEAREAGEAGVDGFLARPVRQSHLYDCVATVMGEDNRAAPLVTQNRLTEARVRDRPRVLVVEDNGVNQKVASHLLEKMGYRVDVVASGTEAVKSVGSTRYAAVLMDCHMPGLDGYQATAQIRRQEKGGQRTPIIAMTASAMEGDRERCLDAGMDDYVSKPVDEAALAAALDGQTSPPRGGPGEREPEETSVPSGADDVLDSTVIGKLTVLAARSGTELLPQLAILFQREANKHMATMRAALVTGDTEGLAEAAHALKSSAVSLGALQVGSSCQHLEELGHSGELSGTEDLVADLEPQLQSFALAFGAVCTR